MKSVVHFEIPVNDVKQAEAFYGSVFSWQLHTVHDDTVMAITAPSDEHMVPHKPGAVNGSIYRPKHPTPLTIVVQVDDIQACLDNAVMHGGKIVDAPTTDPALGIFARFSDPAGNVIGLFQELQP